MELSTTSLLARRLGSVLEQVVGQVYFSPECHANYEALGFDPSSGDANGVALPDGTERGPDDAHVAARSACARGDRGGDRRADGAVDLGAGR